MNKECLISIVNLFQLTVSCFVQNNRAVMPVYIGVNDIGLHIITVDTKVGSRCPSYY